MGETFNTLTHEDIFILWVMGVGDGLFHTGKHFFKRSRLKTAMIAQL